MTRSHLPKLMAVVAATLALGGCAGVMGHGGHGDMGHDMHKGPMAMAKLEPTRGNAVSGMVMFHEQGGHVMAHARLSGLKPGAEHGFHVHEKGDCSSGDGMSTGGHFNPTAQPHGPQDAAHHAGDLPALKADAEGKVDVKLHLSGVTLSDGPTSLIGKGLIVHAGPDDYRTQPTGNSGARIACGVIAQGSH
ncbi:MAG: superoxide dismutase, Cu-Zn family [Pseudomonadota bacterium]|nr:superoxide dismutase, Cu-Zn family [Pseudomonadota bacterium]